MDSLKSYKLKVDGHKTRLPQTLKVAGLMKADGSRSEIKTA